MFLGNLLTTKQFLTVLESEIQDDYASMMTLRHIDHRLLTFDCVVMW